MALDGDKLGEEIYSALGLDNLLPDDNTKNAVKETWKKIGNAIVAHVLANLEIKGVKVKLDKSLNQIFSSGVPVPMDGGTALKAAWIGATAAGTADNATQINDGKGLVK